jgi:hypothetical protein
MVIRVGFMQTAALIRYVSAPKSHQPQRLHKHLSEDGYYWLNLADNTVAWEITEDALEVEFIIVHDRVLKS